METYSPQLKVDIIDELLRMARELTCICGLPIDGSLAEKVPRCKMIGRLTELKEEAQQGHLWRLMVADAVATNPLRDKPLPRLNVAVLIVSRVSGAAR